MSGQKEEAMKLDFPEVLIIILAVVLVVELLTHQIHKYRLRHPHH